MGARTDFLLEAPMIVTPARMSLATAPACVDAPGPSHPTASVPAFDRCRPPAPPARADLERLGEEIAELAAHLHAVTYRLLVRLREFDEVGGWSGFLSCAHWLSWRTGIASGAAREKVRVARALAGLPQLAAAMERGQLSFSKVRALTRIATPANEATMLELARHATAAQVETVVRGWRRIDRLSEAEDERRRHAARYLTVSVDEDGSYVIRGRLDPEGGALFQRALEAAMQTLCESAPERKTEDVAGLDVPTARKTEDAAGLDVPTARKTEDVAGLDVPTARKTEDVAGLDVPTAEQRRADALGFLVEHALASASLTGATSPPDGDADAPAPARPLRHADRVQVVLHVDTDALREDADSGQSVLAGGVRVSAETSRRLACDASRVIMTHDRSGRVLDVGRRTRIVPTAIRRALEHREGDPCCRFPGCTNRITDAHHVRHWADGGPTRLDNLVLLCRRHHRAVHEDGYRLVRKADGSFLFFRPDGRPLPESPNTPAVEPHVLQNDALRQRTPCVTPGPDVPWTSGDRLDLDWTLYTLYAPPLQPT